MLPELNFAESRAQQLRIAKGRRGSVERAAKLNVHNARTNAAKRIVAEMRERERRATDPFEQARLFLGRKGIPVFSEAVYDERFSEATAKALIDKGGWIVGDVRVADRSAVIQIACQRGWGG
ncbi:hypothetical protein [Sphingomonas sp.]|uniref:hypothetical protein n=1 Tax=Sphingomonas sp. TaxID=28214 RepID=UPI00307DC162